MNFFENLGKRLEKNNQKEKHIEDDIKLELAKKLDVIQEFSVDRVEEDKIVLENRKNGEIINVEKSKISQCVKEGDILKFINGRYILDKSRTEDETTRIKNKMNNLWE